MNRYSIYLLLVGLIASFSVAAQQLVIPDTTHYKYTEQMPVFPGGQQALFHLLTDGLRYPAAALRDQVQGKVYVGFAVDSAGHTTDIQVKQGIRADLDAEALRLAQRLAQVQWQPGTQNGRPVKVTYTVPLIFSIAGNLAYGDSLDLKPGPALVLPTPTWATSHQNLPADKGVIYGSCIQRIPGGQSGGLGQYVRLINLDTHKAVRLSVKSPFRTREENAFCVALPPGRYALHSYEFSISKWYGAELNVEPLRKPSPDAKTLQETRYIFTVAAGQAQYVGTWNFNRPGGPLFEDRKERLDQTLAPVYRHLNLAAALRAVPR